MIMNDESVAASKRAVALDLMITRSALNMLSLDLYVTKNECIYQIPEPSLCQVSANQWSAPLLEAPACTRSLLTTSPLSMRHMDSERRHRKQSGLKILRV